MSEKGRNTFVLSDEMRDYFYKIGVKSSNESGNSRSGVFPTNIHPFYLCDHGYQEKYVGRSSTDETDNGSSGSQKLQIGSIISLA